MVSMLGTSKASSAHRLAQCHFASCVLQAVHLFHAQFEREVTQLDL